MKSSRNQVSGGFSQSAIDLMDRNRMRKGSVNAFPQHLLHQEAKNTRWALRKLGTSWPIYSWEVEESCFSVEQVMMLWCSQNSATEPKFRKLDFVSICIVACISHLKPRSIEYDVQHCCIAFSSFSYNKWALTTSDFYLAKDYVSYLLYTAFMLNKNSALDVLHLFILAYILKLLFSPDA